jgi:hypothetical protein
MIGEMRLRYEAFAKHAPYMEKLSIDQNRVVLQDNNEILLKESELQCLLDERSDCIHISFDYSLPELYHLATNEIKVPPSSAYEEIS